MADALTLARVALAAIIVWCGAAGRGDLAATALLAGGLTDCLDGVLARRHPPSRHGAQLDAVADTTLLAATAATLYLLHPEIAGAPLIAVAILYVLSTGLSWLVFGRLVDPRQLSGKAAGGLLYVFALVTLWTGVVFGALMVVALVALAVSCLETSVTASQAIQARRRPSSQRSHAPHAANAVNRSAPPAASVAVSRAARTTESEP